MFFLVHATDGLQIYSNQYRFHSPYTYIRAVTTESKRNCNHLKLHNNEIRHKYIYNLLK